MNAKRGIIKKEIRPLLMRVPSPFGQRFRVCPGNPKQPKVIQSIATCDLDGFEFGQRFRTASITQILTKILNIINLSPCIQHRPNYGVSHFLSNSHVLHLPHNNLPHLWATQVESPLSRHNAP